MDRPAVRDDDIWNYLNSRQTAADSRTLIL